MTTGELCKKLRTDVGLSQKELATAMGVSDYVIGTAERGKLYGRSKTTISKDTVKKYKEYFGVDVLSSTESKEESQTFTDEELAMYDFENGCAPAPKNAYDPMKGVKVIDYTYTVDNNGCAKVVGVNEESLTKTREEEDANYIRELEKEIEELKASLENEKVHADFYEEKFRDGEDTLKFAGEKVKNLVAENQQLRDDYQELLGDRDALLEERDALRDELSSYKRNDPEHDILFELLLRFYKDHTKGGAHDGN